MAILPDSFDAATFVEDQEQASLLLDVRLSGAFWATSQLPPFSRVMFSTGTAEVSGTVRRTSPPKALIPSTLMPRLTSVR